MDIGNQFLQEMILRPFGLECANNSDELRDVLRQVLPSEEAEYVIELLTERSNQSVQGSQLNHEAFYAEKNANFMRGLAITVAFEGKLVASTCSWIDAHEEAFGDTVLDVGCECGLVTAFLAYRFPEKRITAMDHCRESVMVTRELCTRLGIENVEVVLSEDLPKNRTFDTVLSSRVLQENLTRRTRPRDLRFSTFVEKMQFEYKLFQPYVKQLKPRVSNGGVLVTIERLYNPIGKGAWLRALDQAGLHVGAGDISTLSADELEQTNKLQAFIAHKGGKHRDLREALKMNVDEEVLRGASADLQLYMDDCRLLEGYYIFDGTEVIGKYARYQSKVNPSVFWTLEATLDSYAIERRDERMMEIISNGYGQYVKDRAAFLGGQMLGFTQNAQFKEHVLKDPRLKGSGNRRSKR